MKRTLFLFLSLIAFTASAEELIPGRYLVVFKDDVKGPPLRDHAAGLTLAHGGRVGRIHEHALRAFELVGDERAANAIARDPRVAFVEQDRILEPFAIATQALPHWGLDRIDERDRPRNNHFSYAAFGAGVNIYVIDTGVNADAELGSRLVNAYSAITNSQGVPQYNDCNSHGTAVAKLAGGTTSGVAKGAIIRNVRVGSICNGTCFGCVPRLPTVDPQSVGGSPTGFILSDVVAGMNWVAANRIKPAVANVSLGSNTGSATLDNATRGMHNAGVLVVAAAGNAGVDACGASPARVPEFLTIGASDINDARAIFSGGSSNTGTCVDLFAPGKGLNGFDGTSAAAPLVSGAAALYLQTNTTATPATVTSHLLNNATLGRLTGIGSSPNRLLFVPPGGTETDQRPVALGFTCGCNGGRTCTFTNASFTDDFAVKQCQYLVDYDQWNRPVFKFGCGTVTHTYAYPGPYLVEFQVVDDANQTSDFVARWCQ